jgi:very-long-chain (3R)-3-hydroxyacyl-CoA dehydratase
MSIDAVGLVRAPIMTTFIQVFSRLFLTWGVVDLFPNSVRNCPAYPVMLVAWSTTEVIRYSFYAWNLLDEVPYPLLWLR